MMSMCRTMISNNLLSSKHMRAGDTVFNMWLFRKLPRKQEISGKREKIYVNSNNNDHYKKLVIKRIKTHKKHNLKKSSNEKVNIH